MVPQLVARIEAQGATAARIAGIVGSDSKAHIDALFSSPRFVTAVLFSGEQVGHVAWHFFQSEISRTVGPSRHFLRQMEDIAAKQGRTFTIVVHLAP